MPAVRPSTKWTKTDDSGGGGDLWIPSDRVRLAGGPEDTQRTGKEGDGGTDGLERGGSLVVASADGQRQSQEKTKCLDRQWRI